MSSGIILRRKTWHPCVHLGISFLRGTNWQDIYKQGSVPHRLRKRPLALIKVPLLTHWDKHNDNWGRRSCLAASTRTLASASGNSWTITERQETITGDMKEKEREETDCCSRLTFGTVVLLFGTLASLPPPPLQYFQSVILLQLEDGQRDLISERRPWQGGPDKNQLVEDRKQGSKRAPNKIRSSDVRKGQEKLHMKWRNSPL